ncbi:MAG TPA: hypothetical protein ENI98_01760 [Gammaproteobacteria bacterium]|nr:hypothetical protein [Gammaproteobacteria bacterium]
MNKIRTILSAAIVTAVMATAHADGNLKPFILGNSEGSDMASAVSAVKEKLKAAGFEIAGEYSPYDTATIIVITNDELKSAAAKTDFGAFGAAARVTITKGKDGSIQVAYTNPEYYGAAYRMKSDLSGINAKLASALGNKGEYGPASGLSAEDLEDYQYKWLMPYFTDRLELADYDSQAKAVQTVEANLKAGKGGTAEVYRIDLPGQKATVFGVAMKGTKDEECAGDKYIMDSIDFKKTRSTGHLPYEIVVKDGVAYALPAEFRIAISFPDLSMVGSNSFASIMCAPGAIQATLEAAAGGNGS